MSRQFLDAIFRAADANFNPVPGALCYHYLAGTTTPVTTYSDAAMAVPHAWPVVALSDGTWPQIYLPDGTYKVIIKTSAGVTLYTVDNVLQVSSGGLTFDTLALAASSFVPTTTKYATVAGLDYVQDASGTAWQSSNGVKFSPFGTIMPAHWAENTVPFTTDMSAACLAMGRWLAATNGPHRRVYWGNIGVSSPIKLGIGDGTSAWSGYISNITFTGGQIRSIGSTRWGYVDSSGILNYPPSLIILAGSTTYSSENIQFEHTKFDGRYICGGIYFENTNICAVNYCTFVGLGQKCAGIWTSVIDPAVNLDGRAAKNTDLRVFNNKVRGGGSSAAAPIGRTLDGICTSQVATAGVPLVLNGVDIVGGEWVSPDGYPCPIGTRIVATNPTASIGKRLTFHGFADTARTSPITQQVTIFEWSTQLQHTDTASDFMVVTQIVPDDTFTQNVAIMAERETTGILIESADFWTGANSIEFVDTAMYFNNFYAGFSSHDHPSSRKIVVGSNSYNLSITNASFNYTDLILYSHGHKINDNQFLAGQPSAHAIATTGNTSGDWLSFQNNRCDRARSFSTNGELLKYSNGNAIWAGVKNVTVGGNSF